MGLALGQGFQKALAHMAHNPFAPQFTRADEPFNALSDAEIGVVYVHSCSLYWLLLFIGNTRRTHCGTTFRREPKAFATNFRQWQRLNCAPRIVRPGVSFLFR